MLIGRLKKVKNYNLTFLEIVMGKCFDKNIAPQIQLFFNNLQQYSVKDVLFIFSQVEVMDSTGIGILVNFQEDLEQHGFSLRLVDVSSKILHLFEILGLGDFFHMYPTYNAGVLACFPENENAKLRDIDWEKEPLEIVEITNKKTDVPSPTTKTPNTAASDTSANSASSGDLVESLDDEVEEDPPRESKTVPAKKLHTIKIKKKGETPNKGPNSLKIEYYSPMLSHQEFPLKLIFSTAVQKERAWEIVPKISGCVVGPTKMLLHDFELPTEVYFSLVPLTKPSTPSEIILFSPNNCRYQFPFKVNILSLEVVKLILFFGLVIFFIAVGSLFLFAMLPTEVSSRFNSLLTQDIMHIIKLIFSKISFYCFTTSFMVFLGLFFYYYRYLRPQKVSMQINFY